MKRRTVYRLCLVSVIAVLLAAVTGYYLVESYECRCDVAGATPAGRAAKFWPDYSGTTIPPNIAPLNFLLSEPGVRHCVRIHSTGGEPIEVCGSGPKVIIPIKPWRKLLAANKGQKLRVDIFVQGDDGGWRSFEPVINTIAREPIDDYLAYRLITPIYNKWKNVGIYQRDLENFKQNTVLDNRSFDRGCVNCHTFRKNSPKDMLLNVRPGVHRDPPGGMVVVRDGKVDAVVNTKTDFNPIPAIYLAWHPSGKVVAFSSNKITQFFHSTGENREVFDHRSDLALYNIESNTVTSSPKISRPDRMETFPTWSPDGKYLYFCTAPQLPISQYKQVRYDLARISYDLKSNTWGNVETLISARDSHLSVTLPRISPDGRWLLFCMCDHGNFSIYRPDSDLYMMDLTTLKYRRLDIINSDRCESWHSWSSNGRWIVFSSKRRDGLFAKPYFSYIDKSGRAHKPLLLPQADPAFYDSFIKTYNLPQFITGPVSVTPRQLAEALHSADKQVKARLDPKLEGRRAPGATVAEDQYKPGPGG